MQKIAALLLKKNAISFDKEELFFQIQSHPSYPSLHSITGVFDHFNIENIAARVPKTQEVLDQLPNSFIAQINDEDKKQELIKVEVLPKKLDEEVAAYMVEGFGGVMTKLSSDQAEYINVPEEGPFKSDIYKY